MDHIWSVRMIRVEVQVDFAYFLIIMHWRPVDILNRFSLEQHLTWGKLPRLALLKRDVTISTNDWSQASQWWWHHQ